MQSVQNTAGCFLEQFFWLFWAVETREKSFAASLQGVTSSDKGITGIGPVLVCCLALALVLVMPLTFDITRISSVLGYHLVATHRPTQQVQDG
jgi:hypothetical protein